MSVKTKILNPTKVRQRYPWVPKHGITLEPGESIVIDGFLQAKRKRQTKIMQADIDSGRISVIVETDTDNPPSDAEIPLDVPEKEKKEAPKKEKKKAAPVREDTMHADELIPVEPVEEAEANIPGVTTVDEDEQETFYDERGKELPPEEPPVIVENIHGIDEDDILAKTSLDLEDEEKEEEEEEEEGKEPAEEPALPSKSAMKKMKAAEAKKVAESFGMDITDDTTKNDAIEFVNDLR